MKKNPKSRAFVLLAGALLAFTGALEMAVAESVADRIQERLRRHKEKTGQQQPPAESAARQQAATLDGVWTSAQHRYGFRLAGNAGTATQTNSPKFKPGDVILQITSRSGNSFQGQQLFRDGRWKPVTGNLVNPATLQMQEGKFRWMMTRQQGAQVASAPAVQPNITPAPIPFPHANLRPGRPSAPPTTSNPPPAPVVTASASSSLIVKTFPASNVAGGCAILNGYVASPGKNGKIWFEWGTTNTFGKASNAEEFTGEKSVGHRVCTGTMAKIYFRGVAQSGASLAYGDTATFQ
jgi:hypothetical protein